MDLANIYSHDWISSHVTLLKWSDRHKMEACSIIGMFKLMRTNRPPAACQRSLLPHLTDDL